MSDTEEIAQVIEDAAIEIPRQLAGVRNVFEFSYAAALDVQKSFGPGADLMIVLEDVAGFVRRSALPPEDAELVASMIAQEAEVIGFSQSARSSVIRF